MIHSRVLIFAIILLALVCGGCTHTATVTYRPDAVQVVQFDTPVTFRLSKEFCEYNHVRKRMGDSFEMPFGPALRDYAVFVARTEFRDAEVLLPDSSVAHRPSSRFLLEPRVAKVDELMPGLAFQDRQMLIVVEWALNDARTGQTQLLLPIEAQWHEASPLGGWTYGSTSDKLASRLMSALSDNTLKAFGSWEELKGLDHGP